MVNISDPCFLSGALLPIFFLARPKWLFRDFQQYFYPFKNQWHLVNAEQFFFYVSVKAHHYIQPHHPYQSSIVNIVTMVDCCYCDMMHLLPQSKACAVGGRGSCALISWFSPLAFLSSLPSSGVNERALGTWVPDKTATLCHLTCFIK